MGCHAVLQGIFPTQGSLTSPAGAGRFFTSSATSGKLVLGLHVTNVAIPEERWPLSSIASQNPGYNFHWINLSHLTILQPMIYTLRGLF